ncbi:winged helix DNA-binding domain-containing protein [Aquipuribacter nitratireducens]|uniref:Winged helix DNA-binding domain-containing protein n=1 Tax=Aquipuribacter nitratireducens TaxID=650104 RepID=A0ABW0GMZ4_9MICO
MDPKEVALLRLVAQGLVPGERSPVDAVRHLLALQGQDLPGVLRSVALRSTPGTTTDDVAAALDDGRLVRTWPLRGTLHVVATDDVRWLLALTGEAQHARARRRFDELGLDAAQAARALDVAREALAGDGLTRDALLAAWVAGGVPTDGQRGYHLLAHLAQARAVVWGATTRADDGRVTGQRLRLLDEVAPPDDRTDDREALLARLAERYLRSHGPASVLDLARWSGLGVREVRSGVAQVRDGLERVEVDGVEQLMDPTTPERLAALRDQARGELRLPGFDELVLGYADRSATLAPEHATAVVPGGNGVFRPTVVREGRVVGTWRPGSRGRDPVVEPFSARA